MNVLSAYHDELILDVLREACDTTHCPSTPQGAVQEAYRRGAIKMLTAILPLPQVENYLSEVMGGGGYDLIGSTTRGTAMKAT